jgi:hypothetical protein
MLDRVVWDVYSRWRVGELLQRHPGLRIAPSRDDSLHFHGTLEFHLQGPKGDPIHDKYEIQFVVPPKFPAALPRALETGARIPPSFHHFVDGSLCLGAPTELRLRLDQSPNLTTTSMSFSCRICSAMRTFSFMGSCHLANLPTETRELQSTFVGCLGQTTVKPPESSYAWRPSRDGTPINWRAHVAAGADWNTATIRR